ncbi:hypothetical protein [Streptomyces sp. IMTB 2501]|uniref:hypothetical protein n=1 Tax=Streptomyces sp. IMTB 2501 TaxID=1776340 RepID=UPI0015BA3F32|nr:hypothetical protein [Streptomyces sp. IMTB 2501]
MGSPVAGAARLTVIRSGSRTDFRPIERDTQAFQQSVTAGEIQAIGRRAFGPAAKVVSAVELGSGMYNKTYRLTVAGQERPVILRIAPEPVRRFRSERELMRNEYASLPYLAVFAPLLPRVIAADWSHEVIGRALRQLRRPERQRLDGRGRMGARRPPQRDCGRLLPMGAGPDRTEHHQAAGDKARRRARTAGQPEEPGQDGADDPRGLHGRRGRRPGGRRSFRPDPMRQHQDHQRGADDRLRVPQLRVDHTFNAAKYPQASSHARPIQHEPANHPGSKADSKPLYFLPDGDISRNRTVTCPTGWAAANGDTSALNGTTDKELNCDEFAFNATYDSGGMPSLAGGLNPVSSGDACAQTLASKQDGTVHLFNIHGLVPTWKEVCGRSAISGNDNSGSMAGFAAFNANQRLLDRDLCWLNTNMLAACSADSTTVKCTMTANNQ